MATKTAMKGVMKAMKAMKAMKTTNMKAAKTADMKAMKTTKAKKPDAALDRIYKCNVAIKALNAAIRAMHDIYGSAEAAADLQKMRDGLHDLLATYHKGAV